MSHTFDIRFARSAGLAALLEAPANTFRWKGRGLLSIDAQGISIAVKRGLLSLFAPRPRRIAAADLAEVYREGDSLRLEFNAAGARREVVPFWVRDRDTAEKIVRLLPTRRTVEMDEDVSATKRRFRPDNQLLGLFAALMIVGIGSILLVRDRPSASVAMPSSTQKELSGSAHATYIEPVLVPVPVPLVIETRSTRLADAPETSAPEARRIHATPTETPNSMAPTTGETVEVRPYAEELRELEERERVIRALIRTPYRLVPISPGHPAYARARSQLAWFEGEVANLSLAGGESAWWEFTVQIYNSAAFGDPDLKPMIDAELAAVRAWRNYVAGYWGRDFPEHLTDIVRSYVSGWPR